MKNPRKKKRAMKTEEGTVTISFSILPSQKIALTEVAEKKDRSISVILRNILADQVEKWKIEGLIQT